MPDIINTTSGNTLNNTNNKLVDQKSMGVANGVATLDSSGRSPVSQLPQIPVVNLPSTVIFSNDPKLSDPRDPKTNSVNTTEIVNDAVTFLKMQNIAGLRLLGRYSTGSGDIQEIELDPSLVFDSVTNKLKVIGGNSINSSVVGVSVSNLRAFEFPSSNSGSVNISSFSEPEKIVKLEPSNMELLDNVSIVLFGVTNSDNGKIIKISTMGIDYKGKSINVYVGATPLVSSISQTMHELLVKNGAWTLLI